MFRFGYAQTQSGKLDQLLSKDNLTVQELFNVTNIIGDIRKKTAKFVQYCQKNRQFTLDLIKIALNTSQQELVQKNLTQVAYVATQFLTCDDQSLITLFFGAQQTIKNSSQISQKIQQLNLSNNSDIKISQTEEIQLQLQSRQQEKSFFPEFDQYELLKLSLQILNNPQKNQTCLGHIYKIFSFFTRNNASQPLQFFSTNQPYSDLLISNIHYDSIANLLSQMVASQDKSHEYKYEKFKQQIFKKVIEKMFESVQNNQKFEGMLIFIEEVLNNTKQSYCENFEDFKRCANYLVSQIVLKRFLEEAFKNKIESFKNSVSYLQMIIRRINSESQNVDYYYSSHSAKQPTMNFQYNFLYEHLDKMIDFIAEFQQQTSISKGIYLLFLIDLIKNSKYQYDKIDFKNKVFILLTVLKNQKRNGIVKNNMYLLTRQILEKASPDQIQTFLHQQSEDLQVFFQFLSNREDVPLNSNQQICYWKTLAVILYNKTDMAKQIFEKIKVLVPKIEQKFSTILANRSNLNTLHSSANSPIIFSRSNDNANFFQVNDTCSIEFTNQMPTPQVQSTHSVGKNNISIPFLNLPDKKIVSPVKIELELDDQSFVQTQKSLSFMSTSPRGDGIGFFNRQRSQKFFGQGQIEQISFQKNQKSPTYQRQTLQQQNKQPIKSVSLPPQKRISQAEINYYIKSPIFI